MIESVGSFDMYSLLAVCVCAIALAPTRYNIISTLLAAEFLLMIGLDILVSISIATFDQAAYIYTIKLLIQCAFTLAWVYFGAWPLFVVSMVIIGTFSCSIFYALGGIVMPYYIEIMQCLAVLQILALMMAVVCGVRININRRGTWFSSKSSMGNHK
jgi:hypothetical protein